MVSSNARPHLMRTQMCRNAERGLYCEHRELRNNCWFAHSLEEKRCVVFARGGSCLGGVLCTGIHSVSHITSEGQVMEYGRPPAGTQGRYLIRLAPYHLPPLLERLIPTDTAETRPARVHADRVARAELLKLPLERHTERLHMLQFIEETVGRIDLQAYALQGVTMARVAHHSYDDLYKIAVPGLAEKRPSVLRGDRIHVFVYNTRRWMGGMVHFTNVDHIVVTMPHPVNGPVNVHFTMTRTQEQVRHRAIEDSDEYYLSHAKFNESTVFEAATRPRAPLANLTDEQATAVSNFSTPLGPRGTLVWGPPGTGKTTTVVAAIAAVLHMSDTARLLVCTPSNEAADLIVERLVKLFPARAAAFLLRFNAQMRQEAGVPDVVLRHSCPDGTGGFELPSLNNILAASVIVTTLMTSGKAYALGTPSNHFTHVVVDEAGHCTEADLLIALQCAPLATRVLLAGDHKQLAAVVRAPACIDNGMSCSPLQRLMEDARVDRNAHVMLTANFRSHRSIVHVVNVAYGDRLVARATPTHVFQHDVLAINGFSIPVNNVNPLLFLHHRHCERREPDSPSWCNPDEAHMVVDAAINLHMRHKVAMRDIVILTPYLQQRKKIEQILHHRILSTMSEAMEINARGKLAAPIKVSTVEMFQGRESRVVLVSCVRNQKEECVDDDVKFGIGFLKQPQRANVALSRAKDLMLVFGNADVLSIDPMWQGYLDRIESIWDLTADHCVPTQWRRRTRVVAVGAAPQSHMDALTVAHGERPFERDY